MLSLDVEPVPLSGSNLGKYKEASAHILELVGLERLTDRVVSEIDQYLYCGREGEPYIAAPESILPIDKVVSAYNSLFLSKPTRPDTPPRMTVNKLLFSTTGYNNSAYTKDEVSCVDRTSATRYPAHVRLAVHNMSDNRVDPLLHFTGLPFGDFAANKRPDDPSNQLSKFKEAEAEFDNEEGHSEYAMTPLGVKAVLMIALLRKVMGDNDNRSITIPLRRGYMFDGTVIPKNDEVDRYVLSVDSRSGVIDVHRSYLDGNPDGGMGISIGPKQPILYRPLNAIMH